MNEIVWPTKGWIVVGKGIHQWHDRQPKPWMFDVPVKITKVTTRSNSNADVPHDVLADLHCPGWTDGDGIEAAEAQRDADHLRPDDGNRGDRVPLVRDQYGLIIPEPIYRGVFIAVLMSIILLIAVVIANKEHLL